MRTLSHTFRCAVTVVSLGLPSAHPAAAAGSPVTTWTAGLGDWSVPANWSGGVPTADHIARVTAVGIVEVTQPGATCRRLDVAIGGLPTVRIAGGSLTVVEQIHLGVDDLGTMQHVSGSVNAAALVIGGTPSGGGTYLITAGTLTLGSLSIPTTDDFASGSMAISQSSTCTIAGDFYIGESASVVIGGTATLTAGTVATDEVTLDGAFGITSVPSVTFQKLTMSQTAVLNATIVSGSHAPIIVTGPAVIDGTLIIIDVLTDDGSYELLRAGALSGAFDMLSSTPGWSWRVAGGSLFADRSTTPVETTAWGGVKARFAR